MGKASFCLNLPDAPESKEIPEIAQLDELQTFVGSKKNKIWLWTAANHGLPGIIAWALGDRSVQTFKQLWKIVCGWESFWYVTDGYLVYSMFIDDLYHLIRKTYMTRIKGENTRALTSRSLAYTVKRACYSHVSGDVENIRTPVTSLLKVFDYTCVCLNHGLIVQRQKI